MDNKRLILTVEIENGRLLTIAGHAVPQHVWDGIGRALTDDGVDRLDESRLAETLIGGLTGGSAVLIPPSLGQ